MAVKVQVSGAKGVDDPRVRSTPDGIVRGYGSGMPQGQEQQTPAVEATEIVGADGDAAEIDGADGDAAENDRAAAAGGEGRRERRRREVRDRLYEAAIELFLEQGFEATTMDDIASRADVARTTVFNHFPRKTEFLGEWSARRRAAVAQGLRERQLNNEPIDVIIGTYMQLLAELNLTTREEAKELMNAALADGNMLDRPPLADTLAVYLRRAQRRGQIRKDVNVDRVGVMLSASYFAMLIGWCSEDPPRYDLVEALSGAARTVLHGIAPPLADPPTVG